MGTDEQKQKLEEIHLEMKQKMEQMRQAGHDAMVNALSMTSLQEDGLDSINKESNEVQKALMEKAKAKGVQIHLPRDVIIADDFSNDANKKLLLTCSNYKPDLVMQYSKHCGDRKKDSGGDKR